MHLLNPKIETMQCFGFLAPSDRWEQTRGMEFPTLLIQPVSAIACGTQIGSYNRESRY